MLNRSGFANLHAYSLRPVGHLHTPVLLTSAFYWRYEIHDISYHEQSSVFEALKVKTLHVKILVIACNCFADRGYFLLSQAYFLCRVAEMDLKPHRELFGEKPWSGLSRENGHTRGQRWSSGCCS